MTYAYLARRLALLLPTALLASVIVFAVMRALPGDVAATILSGGGETTHSPEVREALRAELGLDAPLPVQYARWLAAMFDGSFGGDALIDGQPIRAQIARQAPVTALLALYALAITLA
ncbi:MAG: ABC transporter permease, partial [Chloroflexota bacterium]|nr:ABC transporter permease [Chloroflexota bacterium]